VPLERSVWVLITLGFGLAGGWLISAARSSDADPPPSRELTALQSEVREQLSRIEALERALAEERTARLLLAGRIEAGPTPSGGEEGRETAPPPAEASVLLRRLLAEVERGGVLSATGTTGTRFVGLARTFPREGLDLLRESLRSPRTAERTAAVRLAARFPGAAMIDPLLTPLIEPLAEVARGDRSELVRILAAEALSRFPAADADRWWLSILGGEGPAGARVHAWIALARAGHEAAVSEFVPLLDRCDRTIPADLVVETALALADPRLLPALRAAFDHPEVSDRHRMGILRAHAREGEEALEFVRARGMEGAGEAVRALARELAPPPPIEAPPGAPGEDPTAPRPPTDPPAAVAPPSPESGADPPAPASEAGSPEDDEGARAG
jgi:hypothetical protein